MYVCKYTFIIRTYIYICISIKIITSTLSHNAERPHRFFHLTRNHAHAHVQTVTDTNTDTHRHTYTQIHSHKDTNIEKK